MTDSLLSLFQAIAETENEVQRYRLFIWDRLPQVVNKSKLFQLAVSIDHNPVLRYVVEHHAPVHEEVLLSPGKWRTICPRFDHGHVMAGPIVDDGSLVGGLALTRDRNSHPFNSQETADLGALCLHISTKLAKIQSQSREFNSPSLNLITPRELQIAELVAQGLTNAEIGQNLWITENSVKQALKRIFRKLSVSSRAEMTAKLFCSTSTDCQSNICKPN
jgi:DNA-binding CsgD family transcriptional regulator